MKETSFQNCLKYYSFFDFQFHCSNCHQMVYFYVFFIVLIFFVNGSLVALEDMGGKGNFNFDILTIKKITSGEKTDFLWGGGGHV